MRNKIVTFAFIGMLVIVNLLGLIIPDKTYSDNEKRSLMQYSKLSIKDFRSGTLGKNLETYLTDQFPARDNWITIKTLTEKSMGKKESNGVYFGKDGYLIDKFTSYNSELLKKNVAALKKFQDAQNVPVSVMLVPDKAEILKNKLPAYAPGLSQRELLNYIESNDINMTDVYDILSDHSDEYIYYRTDHHYTSLGAYYCYSAWMKNKGLVPDAISDWNKEVLCDNFYGTTYAKINYPFVKPDEIIAYYKTLNHTVNYNGGQYITDSIYERKYLEGKNQYAVFFNSNQATTVVNGSGKGKLLIIKDSYANTFAQFTVDDYEETHMIDLRFYSKSINDYIKDNGITEVLVLYELTNFVGDNNITKLVF